MDKQELREALQNINYPGPEIPDMVVQVGPVAIPIVDVTYDINNNRVAIIIDSNVDGWN